MYLNVKETIIRLGMVGFLQRFVSYYLRNKQLQVLSLRSLQQVFCHLLMHEGGMYLARDLVVGCNKKKSLVFTVGSRNQECRLPSSNWDSKQLGIDRRS